jgi:primosomal protein N' (replication factor Y)
MAALDATPEQLDAFLELAKLPADVELLGPVPLTGEAERLLVRVPRSEGASLAAALQTASRLRSMKSEPVVRVRLDPAAIG